MDHEQKDHALSRASAALSRDCEVLGERSNSLLESAYDLQIEEHKLRNQITANSLHIVTQYKISEALQRALKSMREASDSQSTRTEDEQTIQRIHLILNESMEHIRKQLKDSSSFQIARWTDSDQHRSKEKNNSSKQEQIARDLIAFDEAKQRIWKILGVLPNSI